MSTEDLGTLLHTQQTEPGDLGLLIEGGSLEAATVIGDLEAEGAFGEFEGHAELLSLGVQHRVVDGLLCDAKGHELDLWSKAGLGAEHAQPKVSGRVLFGSHEEPP